MNWWHGGPPIHGDEVVPPNESGLSRSGNPLDGVYITPERDLAATYASTCRNGWIYEVEPMGEIRQDDGSLLAPGQSMVCDRARIIRRFKPSNAEVAHRRRAFAAAMRQLAP